MDAVERIEAAIQKLEGLKFAAPVGPWRWDEKFGGDDYGLALTNAEGDEVIGAYNYHCCTMRVDPNVADSTAELIVTLHRTIDAQLAILRESYLIASSLPASVAFPSDNTPDIHALALAEAINGVTS